MLPGVQREELQREETLEKDDNGPPSRAEGPKTSCGEIWTHKKSWQDTTSCGQVPPST